MQPFAFATVHAILKRPCFRPVPAEYLLQCYRRRLQDGTTWGTGRRTGYRQAHECWRAEPDGVVDAGGMQPADGGETRAGSGVR